MTAAIGNSQYLCTPVVRRQVLLRASGLFWASLALISLAAFKAAQVRLQPDAIASGVPGFLWRLVLQPLELVMHGVISVDPGSLALQAVAVTAICGALAASAPASATVPGERPHRRSAAN